MISSYLEALKTQKNLTNRQISEMSGVPTATVQRIMAGTGESSFDSVAKIISAIGGSLDELAGISLPESEEVHILRRENEILKEQAASYEKLAKAYESVYAEKEKATIYLKKIIRYLAIALAAMVIVFVGIVIFDILNGGVGYIRYDELSQQDRLEVLLSVLPGWGVK